MKKQSGRRKNKRIPQLEKMASRSRKRPKQENPEVQKFNPRQRKYRENRLAGMSQYDAARAAGYSHHTARGHGHRIEKIVRQSIIDELNQAGGTDRMIARELVRMAQFAEVLELESLLRLEVDEGNQRKVQVKRKFMRVPDTRLRLQALETIARLKKHLIPSPLVDNSEHTHLTIVLEKDDPSLPENQSLPGGTRAAVQPDREADFRVALADEP